MVHDELNFSDSTRRKGKVQKIVIEEMENAYRMQVPLRADCGWGSETGLKHIKAYINQLLAK